MSPSKQLLCGLLLAAFASGAMAPAFAQSNDDRNAPIRITADVATRDELTGETRYAGNVELIQGSLVITADELVVLHDQEEASSITATGAPATLSQPATPEHGEIKAWAGRIVYVRSEDQVRLTKDARIEQDGATVRGGVIDYLISERQVRATGSDDDPAGGRVEVVIPPAALGQDEDS